MPLRTIEDLKENIAQMKFWEERPHSDDKPEIKAVQRQLISDMELEIARRRRIAEYLVPLPQATDNGKQKRKLTDDADGEHYRQKANQLLDAHSSDKGEVLQDLVRERGFDREWLLLHKILHQLRNLKKSLQDAMKNTYDEMQLWEEEILEDLQMTGIELTENLGLVSEQYQDKYDKDLREQYCKTFHFLSSIVYDKFFVPFCAMLFTNLNKLMDGKFIDDSEACQMLKFCVQGLSANGYNLKMDIEQLPISAHWCPHTFQEQFYFGNSNKFTRVNRQEVLIWAYPLWEQVEKRRQLQRQSRKRS